MPAGTGKEEIEDESEVSMTLDISIRERMGKNKNYLNGEALSDGKDRIVQIKDVCEELVKNPQASTESNEVVIHFEGDTKPMVVTAECQMANLITATGTDRTKDWVGKKIQLYGELGVYFGKRQWAVRVREFAPK